MQFPCDRDPSLKKVTLERERRAKRERKRARALAKARGANVDAPITVDVGADHRDHRGGDDRGRLC
jgi:hypothetical protein